MTTAANWAAEKAAGRTVKAVSSAQVTVTIKRVRTMRGGSQAHHGYKGYVYVTFEGERRPETFYCCTFHQKPKPAREHAATLARAFTRLIPKDA